MTSLKQHFIFLPEVKKINLTTQNLYRIYYHSYMKWIPPNAFG